MTDEVFVGSYAGADEPGIHVMSLAPDGTLQRRGSHAGVHHPSFLVLHPDGEHLYAVSETAAGDGREGTVHAFAIERAEGTTRLVPLGHRPSGGDHPCHLGIDGSGRWLAVANYGGGSVSVFPIEPDGALGAATTTVRHTGRGHHPERQARPHAHAAVFSGDDHFLLVADLGIDRVMVYAFRDGAATEVGALVAPPGSGPRHLVAHPDGRHLFVVNELDSTLAVYAFDGAGGDVHPRHTVSTLPEPHPGNLAAGVALAADGRTVYVSNRGHDSLAVFAWDPGAGLRRSSVSPGGGRTPRSFALTPDGRRMVVANQGSDAVTVLPLLDGDAIGPGMGHVDVPAPSCVVVGSAST